MASACSAAAALLSAILALLPAAVGAAAAPEALLEPHDFRAQGYDCKSCHASVGLRSRGKMLKPVSALCGACHRLPGQSHPVDIKPSMPVPPDLLLDENGQMTCATCHDPHRSYLNPLTGKRTMYLRRDEPKRQTCEACHRI